MNALNIRPVMDLRNKYPDVEPYDRITRAEAEIDAGKGMDARESLRRTKARLHG